jgi:hypothetical protein
MKTEPIDDQLTDTEIVRRREATLKRMLNTPATCHNESAPKRKAKYTIA